MPQSDGYKNTNAIAYLANFPGARRERDILVVEVDGGEIDVTDRSDRWLGKVDVNNLPEPVETVISDALKSDGTDSLLVQEDTPLDVSGAVVTVAQNDTFTVDQASTLLVQQDNPLDVSGAVVSVSEDTPLDVSASTVPTEEQSPNAIENTGGNQIDPATEQTIQSILDSVATEQTLSSADAYLQSIDNNVAQQSTLSALAAALQSNNNDKVLVDHPNRLDISSRDGRNLGDVDVTAVNDSVQTEDSDSGFFNGASLSADGTISTLLSGQGADNLKGRVVSDSQYTVELSWQDNNGNEIFRDQVASGVAGGTETTLNETAISPNVELVIADGSSTTATVNGTAHLT